MKKNNMTKNSFAVVIVLYWLGSSHIGVTHNSNSPGSVYKFCYKKQKALTRRSDRVYFYTRGDYQPCQRRIHLKTKR